MSTAYHNLGLSRQAYDCCAAIEALSEFAQHAPRQIPHLYRDKLNALMDLNRFSIREAEFLAAQVEDVCEARVYRDEEIDLLVLLIRRSLARAYIRYGNLRKADRLLRDELDRLDKLSYIGPLHKVMVLRTSVELSWKHQDRDKWSDFVQQALRIARQAGLYHQIQEIQRSYDEKRDHARDW